MKFKLLTAVIAISTSCMAAAPGFAEDMLETVLAHKQLVVGMEVANPPFETYDAQKVVGLDADIAALIGKQLGVEVKFVDSAWAGILPALLANKFDMILSGMIVTPDRLAKVDFSMPYYEMGRAFLVKAGDTSINGPMDLSGKRVGGQVASPAMKDLDTLNTVLAVAGKPPLAAIKTYDQVNDGYLDLRYNRIDAYVQSREGVVMVLTAQPGVFKMVPGDFDAKSTPQYLGIAIRRDNPKFMKALNDVLSDLKKDGELAALQKKWIGVAVPTPDDYSKLN